MSTRGALGVIAGEQEKIAYNHSDSYPDWLGVKTLKWLRSMVEGNQELVLRTLAEDLRVVRDGDPGPSEFDRQRLARYANSSVGARDDGWYCLLRETQGDLAAMLEAGVIEDAAGFPLDSLWCEWAYLVDVDAEVFEVYKGFQQEPPSEGRWAGRATEPTYVSPSSGDRYWPVGLAAAWPFDTLPSDELFLATLLRVEKVVV